MKVLLGSILSIIGPANLLRYAWDVCKPQLEKWAKNDNEEDWDDAAVKVLDEVISKITGKIK